MLLGLILLFVTLAGCILFALKPVWFPAAITAAAVALRECGFSGRITLLGKEALEPYDRTVLSKFVLNDMPVSEVPPLRPADYWKSQQVERLEATIVGLDAIEQVAREDLDGVQAGQTRGEFTPKPAAEAPRATRRGPGR